MNAIAVDDEPLMLYALVKAVKASSDITSVVEFGSCEETLKWVEKNLVDVAFLDIDMRGMGGLSLAQKLMEIHPDCKVVFCTGYEQYAVAAFKIRVSGYLMKPVSPEEVQEEIDHIKGVRAKENRLTVNCFGNFEVYSHGERLVFKRTKTKELLAFLVDRKGAGMDAIVRQSTYSYSLDIEKIDCDYYTYLETGVSWGVYDTIQLGRGNLWSFLGNELVLIKL